jgi:signal transduction histidine kinase
VSGAALLAATYVLFERATAFTTPKLPTIPHAPAIKPLPDRRLPAALAGLFRAQARLTKAQHQLLLLPHDAGHVPPLLPSTQLARDQRQLTRDQRQISTAIAQLTRAERQVAATGPVQAAQRASDSHELLVNSGIALALAAALAVVAGWLVAGRMLRPIRTITRTARRISSSNLHERLALDGPKDELKELGDTLDELFARLEAAFASQHRFVANAAHELRTPLTRERALVQVALGDTATPEAWRSTGEELLASNRHQEALIDALLTLASTEGGLEQSERCDLATICREVLGRLDPAGLRIESAIRSAPFDGDPRLVERLVANLAANAVGHNVPDGSVRFATQAVGGHAVLQVSNTGPEIPPAELDRLFEPFQRLGGRIRTRNGHGLGLSIVRAIASAHGASVSAEALAGGGLSVSVEFPAPSAAGVLDRLSDLRSGETAVSGG